MMTIVYVALAVVGVVLVTVGYRAFAAKRTRRLNKSIDDKYAAAADVSTASVHNDLSPRGATPPVVEYITNDIRHNKDLLKYRIELSDIVVDRKLAQGGHGVIYKASLQGVNIAVKKMLPDTLQNDAALTKFMDEIRLCAMFDHPMIVSFVGIAWTSLRDLSVATDFMLGGDLWALVQKHTPSPEHWLDQWTAALIHSKALIAQDVVEAMVYLHSFYPPIMHRDLKSRNVLVDEQSNAKLSDFGISREMSVDETMTSGVGTAAWIATEVLRGEKYTEMADIYSLGVLLVELDRCSHPHANDPTLQPTSHTTKSGFVPSNTQVVILVSAGRLRPRTSPDCPEDVQALVCKCVSFEPSDRPTAMEVAYALRQMNRPRKG